VYKIEDVRNIFKSCELLLITDEYKNRNQQLQFKCLKCKYKGSVRLASLIDNKNAQHCRFCSQDKNRLQIEQIRAIAKRQGCKILSQKYVNAKSKLKFICSCGHIVCKSWDKIKTNGFVCSKCKQSLGEKTVKQFLKLHKYKFIEQHIFDELFTTGSNKQKYFLPFDFYLPEMNMCVEYDGKQHFVRDTKFQSGFQNLIQNDVRKNNFCIKKNIRLIRISYKEFSNIENILQGVLNG
jgi:very-short-patch-repair endonuclease